MDIGVSKAFTHTNMFSMLSSDLERGWVLLAEGAGVGFEFQPQTSWI